MVMSGFYFISAALVVVALLLLLVPLLRRPTRNRARYALPIVLVLGLPIATAGLYRLVGTPDAIATRVYAAPAQQTDQTTPQAPAAGSTQAQTPAISPAEEAQLQALDAWMQQARAHEQENRSAEARDAYAKALKLAPDNSAAIVGWIAADMGTRSDFAIDAASRTRLQQVIAREPDHQRALWLLGISDFQQQNYSAATEHWRHLHDLLDTGSAMQKAVAEKIAVAESLASARQAKRAAR
ncbi:tetratricopeptide repeat protein [Xanthomonas hydrangeae]|uniref:Tetratricopeptide repeat protein n=2 Tax=Xanthomonas hydrangeae TaxID=2775159 RepID=A0AAU0B8D0_9XANT|nr:tetratricopeptide repeat protein [Xanthomonas hydrangeae]WOB49031.1 tetratricopeptide repeat protein [Xanthomonas hydrangeae]